ncbi:MAG: hypothetical protein LBS96_01205 [Oscillospiraceae bacterium]|nr:hypothetical protein [Oscillospiraceae bacterium]
MELSEANPALWQWLLQLGAIALALLGANILLRVAPGFKKSLLPTAVLAGFLLLALRYTGLVAFDKQLLEVLAYHGIAIGFAALSLKANNHQKKAKSKGALLTLLKTGALIVGGYLLQGFLGLATSLLLHKTLLPGFFPAAGILLPMGYGQGPGQANNIGGMYEGLGFAGGRSFGLSIAAAGYLSACIVGVIYLNIISRRRAKFSPEEASILSAEGAEFDQAEEAVFEELNEIPVTGAVDRLSIQITLVLGVYLAAYGVIRGVTALLQQVAPGAAVTVRAMLWGFNFLVATGVALLAAFALKKLRKKKVIKQQYQNDYLLSRISGFAFDVMIVAAIAAIDISQLREYLLPFLLMTVLGAFFTLWYLLWLCPKIYPGYKYEAILSMYGMLTGTISSGVLLLREVDPQLKSPAVYNLLAGGGFAVLFGAPVLAFVAIAPRSVNLALLCLGLMALYLAALTVFMVRAGRKAGAAG